MDAAARYYYTQAKLGIRRQHMVGFEPQPVMVAETAEERAERKRRARTITNMVTAMGVAVIITAFQTIPSLMWVLELARRAILS